MSGMVESNAYYKFNKVEIRAALPRGKLLRPTVVLRTKGTYGDPHYGQIDLLVYNQKQLTNGVHVVSAYRGNDTVPDVALDQFNVYSVERINQSLIFRVNDRITYVYAISIDGYNPFQMSDGFRLVLNVGVGGHLRNGFRFFDGDQQISVGEAHDWQCSALIVDYIRIVERGDSQEGIKLARNATTKSAKDICSKVMKGIRPELPPTLDWVLISVVTMMNMTIFIVTIMLVKYAKKNYHHYKNKKGVIIGHRLFDRK